MTRRFRLPHVRRVNYIVTIAVIALLLVGAGGYGLARLASHGNAAEPTATPAALAEKDPPKATSAATAAATPAASPAAATPGAQAKGTCAAPAAQPVSKVPEGWAAPGRALVTVGALNMRSGPSTDCPVVGSLGFGMQVTIHSGLLKDGDYYWRHVTTPEGDGYTLASAYQNMPATPPPFVEILMYHHIEAGDDNLHVPPAEFEQQMKWLHDQGYVSITPDDLYKALYKGLPLPAKPIMISIDDGNPSTLLFKQILDKYGFRGVYFLPNYAKQTPEQIRELDKSGQVCAHTASHPFLDTLSYSDQDWQITNNQQWLEGILGHPVTCFAYPFGRYNDDTNTILKKDGFKIAFNAWGGASPISSDVDPLHVLRKEIDPQFDLPTFQEIVTKGW